MNPESAESRCTVPGGRILIVDDVPDILHFLRDVLIEQGYDVAATSDPVSALALARTFHPDVMVINFGMPRVNGIDLARELEANGFHDTPKIVTSSENDWLEAAITTRLFYASLSAPYDLDDLICTVASAVNSRRTHA